MVFDRLWAELQDVGDFLRILSFGNQLENLALPARQLFEWTLAFSDSIQGELLDEPLGDFATKIDFPVNHASEGGFRPRRPSAPASNIPHCRAWTE